MLLLAEMVPAEELTANSYVLKIVAADEIDDAVTALCERLSGACAPLTMAATKTEVRQIISDFEDTDHAIVEHVYGSADFREGVDGVRLASNTALDGALGTTACDNFRLGLVSNCSRLGGLHE